MEFTKPFYSVKLVDVTGANTINVCCFLCFGESFYPRVNKNFCILQKTFPLYFAFQDNMKPYDVSFNIKPMKDTKKKRKCLKTIKMPHRVIEISSKAKIYQRVYDFEELEDSDVVERRLISKSEKETESAFSFAGDSNILFIRNVKRLNESNGTEVEITYQENGKFSIGGSSDTVVCDMFRLTIVVIVEEGSTKLADYPCSEFGLKSECESKSHSWSCHWIKASKHQNQNYSTCSLDAKTCPDRKCDELEKIDTYAICPQDCQKNIGRIATGTNIDTTGSTR